jgi:hypothetical protein
VRAGATVETEFARNPTAVGGASGRSWVCAGDSVARVCPEDVVAVGGTLDQGFDTVNVQGLLMVSLDELGATYEGVLPGLLG